MTAISLFDKVQKRKGFQFRGTVVAIFFTLEGKRRCVVEHFFEAGMLHIYDPEQLELQHD